MKILVIGNGGREHALAWKLAQSERVSEVLVAPGNAGTAIESKCRNSAIQASDSDALIALVKSERIDLTVVGPEGPLVAGIVDKFRAQGLPIFGPSARAAQLEGSKSFAKDFLQRNKIPTAAYAVFDQVQPALDYIRNHGAPIVIKADGLAAGKGVIVATSVAQAEAAVNDMLASNRFGAAGARVVIEEFLSGEEASFICMVDGKHALAMASSQDHKRVGNNDTGPNTGGMGAYSPAPMVTPEIHARIMREVIQPTIAAMSNEGAAFTGFLYAGLMIDESGAAKVIEFNVRMGDPETQPIMMRLESDLLELIECALAGKLDCTQAKWSEQVALGVVMAAANYPDTPRSGDVIHGHDLTFKPGRKVFHAGTAMRDGMVVTAGGRVLCVVALGTDIMQAQANAYDTVNKIGWAGEFHRDDIGWRAIGHEHK